MSRIVCRTMGEMKSKINLFTMANSCSYFSTSIHWHGIRQVNTNEEDGVNGITECKFIFCQEVTL